MSQFLRESKWLYRLSHVDETIHLSYLMRAVSEEVGVMGLWFTMMD